MKAHDPCADTLTPFWRDKVNRAFREVPLPPARPRDDRRTAGDHSTDHQSNHRGNTRND